MYRLINTDRTTNQSIQPPAPTKVTKEHQNTTLSHFFDTGKKIHKEMSS